MRRVALLALLCVGLGAWAAPSRAQFGVLEITNYTFSGGDPLFPVTDDLVFQNLALTETFSNSTTASIALPRTTLGSAISDPITFFMDSDPFLISDPVNGPVRQITLTGSLGTVSTLNIQTSFGGTITPVGVTNPNFSATLSSPYVVGASLPFQVQTSGGSFGLGTFAVVAVTPEPGTPALVIACALASGPLLWRRRMRRR